MTDSVDASMINELKDLMEDEFSLLIETYITDSDQRLTDLEQAIDGKNAEQIRELAHAFKGSSSNLGAQPLADICFELENMGRDGQVDGAPEVLIRLKDEYTVVKSYFSDML